MECNYRFYPTASFLLCPACCLDPGIGRLSSMAPTPNSKAGRNGAGNGTRLFDSRSSGVNRLCSVELVQSDALFGRTTLDPSSDWGGRVGPYGADSSPATGTKSVSHPLRIDWLVPGHPASTAGGFSVFLGSILFLSRNLWRI